MGDWTTIQSLDSIFPTTASLGAYSGSQWHYSISGKKYGPIEGAKLKEMILRRDLLPTDLVQADGEKDWTAVSDLPEDALREPPNIPFLARTYSYTGFTKRALAFGIDALLLLVVIFISAMVFNGFVPPLLSTIYFVSCESSPAQATLGKRVMGIKIISRTGKRLTYWHAFWRDLSKGLSLLTLGIGFVLIGFTPRKQGLHDLMAGTLVINDDIG